MLSNVLLTVLTIAFVAAFHPEPIHKSANYVVYPLKDNPHLKNRNIQQRQETHEKNLRATVEFPSNTTAPEDYGGNFGDLTFENTNKDGDLLVRETITNNYYEEDMVIFYNQTIEAAGSVSDFNVLNFGRERGFGYRAAIYYLNRYVEAEIIVPAYYEVRILMEIYGSWD